MINEKFPLSERTFETRLKFINELFSNTFEPEQIMASCIQHKLDSSFDVYIKSIHRSLWNLAGRDPMAILKQIDG